MSEPKPITQADVEEAVLKSRRRSIAYIVLPPTNRERQITRFARESQTTLY